jgi:hypothetical protein
LDERRFLLLDLRLFVQRVSLSTKSLLLCMLELLLVELRLGHSLLFWEQSCWVMGVHGERRGFPMSFVNDLRVVHQVLPALRCGVIVVDLILLDQILLTRIQPGLRRLLPAFAPTVVVLLLGSLLLDPIWPREELVVID